MTVGVWEVILDEAIIGRSFRGTRLLLSLQKNCRRFLKTRRLAVLEVLEHLLRGLLPQEDGNRPQEAPLSRVQNRVGRRRSSRFRSSIKSLKWPLSYVVNRWRRTVSSLTPAVQAQRAADFARGALGWGPDCGGSLEAVVEVPLSKVATSALK